MARKKVPQSARLSAGGVQSLFGQCPNGGGVNLLGSSLNLGAKITLILKEQIYLVFHLNSECYIWRNSSEPISQLDLVHIQD